MNKITKIVPYIYSFTAKKTSHFYKFLVFKLNQPTPVKQKKLKFTWSLTFL